MPFPHHSTNAILEVAVSRVRYLHSRLSGLFVTTCYRLNRNFADFYDLTQTANRQLFMQTAYSDQLTTFCSLNLTSNRAACLIRPPNKHMSVKKHSRRLLSPYCHRWSPSVWSSLCSELRNRSTYEYAFCGLTMWHAASRHHKNVASELKLIWLYYKQS